MPSSDVAARATVEGLPALAMPLIPLVSVLEEPFWKGGRDGGLHLQRCGACGAWAHPPFPSCRVCGSSDVAFVRASGRGEVYTFSVNLQRWAPTLELPYVVAIVAPEEAPDLRLFTNLVDVDVHQVAIGMPVEVHPVDIGQDVWLPVFRPRETEQV